MHTLYFDSPVSDAMRRQRLYQGQIFVFSPRPSTLAFCQFAREMIEDAFAPLDPRKAQYTIPVEEYVAIVAPLKPKFIHHPQTKQLIQEILREFNCDLAETYLDVPRLRTVTSDGYLTSGVGYAFHPHRDTWYSAPMCQLNWWLPIYDFESESAMAFFPRYWSQPVKNESNSFNYYEYNKTGRKNAALHIKKDTRKQPHATETIEIEPQLRVVCPVGGVILFSAAQMHATVPNSSGSSRYSIDFRTVNVEDVLAKKGANNIDSAPTGTSLRDFMCSQNLERLSQQVINLYETEETVKDGILVYQPES